MNGYLTDFDYYAQQSAFWNVIFDMALRLSADICAGAFDADAQARREAEELLAETERFYGSLLTA